MCVHSCAVYGVILHWITYLHAFTNNVDIPASHLHRQLYCPSYYLNSLFLLMVESCRYFGVIVFLALYKDLLTQKCLNRNAQAIFRHISQYV